jgi:superfamily I DNA/RNA helicase
MWSALPLPQAGRSLVSSDPAVSARITVKAIGAVGHDLFAAHFGEPQLASAEIVKALIAKAAAETPGHKFPTAFLFGEWADVVDAWQLRTWEAYRDVSRLGRKTRIGGKQREVLWSIYERVLAALAERNLITRAGMFGKLSDRLDSAAESPFHYAVIDEAQDLSVPEARFLSVLTVKEPNGLFLAGDLGQRIFQQPFSWKALGLDVRGRSFTLRINYRTSHQIRVQADRLLPGSVSDVDGNSESRKGTISIFDGPPPLIVACKKAKEERDCVARWISACLQEGCQPHEIGVFVRSEAQMERARAALKAAATPSFDLNNENEVSEGRIAVGTMHTAKGLEFRSVVVMACDDEVIPLQERIETIADDAALEEVYDTERHLLYVACTRARDSLLVTGVEPVSEFLDDLRKPTH